MLLRYVHAAADVPTSAINPLAQVFPTGTVSLTNIFGLIMNIVVGIGIALTVIFLVLGGIQYITARGDVKAADAARNSLTNAVIGFVVVLAALTIRYVVTNVIGATTTGFNNIAL